MIISDPERSSLIEGVAFHIIRNVSRRYDVDSTGFYFNKVMSLLHHRYNIGLSHCWYRWGDEVVRSGLSGNILWHHDLRSTRVTYEGASTAPEIPDNMKVLIDGILDEFPMNEPELIGDAVYSYAPYEFQRTFRALRKMIDLRVDGSMDELKKHNLDSLKRKVAAGYPSLPFATEDLNISFTLWNESFDEYLERGDHDGIRDVNETFWFDVCYHLRLDSNENVPDHVQKIWRDHLPFDSRRLSDKLLDHCIELRGASFSDAVAGMIDRRKEEDAEYRELVEGMFDGKDFDGELAESGKGYTYRSRSQ